MEVLKIFPQIIFKEKVPNTFSYIKKFLNSQKTIFPQKGNWERSKNTYVLNNPEYKDFSEYILDQTLIFSQKYIGLSYNEYKLSQSWISIKHPGQHHSPHTHPNSLISGVFYYGDIFESTPGISFQQPPSHNNGYTLDISYLPNRHPSEEFITYSISEGDMFLFPSYLPHAVLNNNTNYPRKCLSFNIIPKNGFGSRENLTELKL